MIKKIALGLVGIIAIIAGYFYFKKPKITKKVIFHVIDDRYRIVIDVDDVTILDEVIYENKLNGFRRKIPYSAWTLSVSPDSNKKRVNIDDFEIKLYIIS